MKICSEGMELRKYNSLSDAASDIGVSKQTFAYAHKNNRSLVTGRKGGAKAFFIK